MDGLSSVIVPLYVYPSAGAWDPFHDVYDTVPLLLSLLIIPGLTTYTAFRASSFPRIHFTVVLNVHNGPGEGALPNAEYTAAIEALNSLSNVRTIGYVATTWCTRDLSSVLDDIAAFSFWGEYDSSLALSGVFVDETPTQYSTDYAVYLDSIAQAVQDSAGLKDNYIGKLSPPSSVLKVRPSPKPAFEAPVVLLYTLPCVLKWVSFYCRRREPPLSNSGSCMSVRLTLHYSSQPWRSSRASLL